MKRKILVTLLAFCLIASLCVVGAAADSSVATWDELTSAISETTSGTIALTQDISTGAGTTEIIKINDGKNIIIDLGGKTLTACLEVDGAELTLVNGTVKLPVEGGSLESTPAYVHGSDDESAARDYSVLNVGSDVVLEGTNGYGMIISGHEYTSNASYGATINIEGTVNGPIFISGNMGAKNALNADANATTINVLGGADLNDTVCMNGAAVVNVYDGATITGDDAVAIKRGTLNVYGGTFEATGEKADPAEANTSGSETTGSAISITSTYNNEHSSINVNIMGGTFISRNNAAVYVGHSGSSTQYGYRGSVDVAISDGSFTSGADVSAVYIADKIDADTGITTEQDYVVEDVITGGTFISGSTASDVSKYFPDNTAMEVDKDTGKVVPSSDAVAEVDGVPYKTLQAAIDAADPGDTVTLVANVDEDIAAGTPLKVEKDITIEGKGKTISLTLTNSTASDGRDKILQVEGENAKLTLNNVKLDINGFVDNANEDRACGDAIDLYLGGDLEANNSTIDIDNVAAAFVIQTAGETIKLNNTTVTADNVRGNGSQGGEWTVKNSSIRFTNCGSHGLSVETADVTNSTITVDGAGLCAVYGKELHFGANTTVNVTNSGPAKPTENWNKTETYYGAVQIKELPGCSLTVESSAIINVSGTNNTVYLPDGAKLVNNGTINATVNVPADSDMNVVLFVADGRQYDVQVVNDGDSVRMPTLSKSGYTFTGWRVNNSNTIVKGGESYPITANTTFTAVWNMIMIPDTYDIAVDQPAHGTVDVSLSNASQGSVITVTATPDEGYELVYITVDGEPISGNSFVMPDHAVEVSALFAEIGKEVNFVDVSRADWFYDYVQYVAQNGLMEGTTRTAFEPNASMTRAMFWTVLARIDGETITGDAWKTLAQTWAVESGISDGTNADALITREQMVTMLYRYAGSPVTGGMAISEFTDGASVSDYATDAVTWALSEGILTGMGDGILAPQGTATRAQAAAMLMRFVEA